MPRSDSPRSPEQAPAGAQATLGDGSASAQGSGAQAVGPGAVLVDGDSTAPINTGTLINSPINSPTYQTIIQQAAQAGASATELRCGYLAWLSMRANELPLLAAEGGRPVQLSSVYTALLTEGRETGLDGQLAPASTGNRLSALEALDHSRCLVLMGGPGSGKTTFLNFVALCMAGELLRSPTANLERLCQPIPPEPEDAGADEARPKPQCWTHGALLPVRVVLRDFAASLPPPGTPANADTLWHFIVGQLPEQLRRYADDLQRELLGGRADPARRARRSSRRPETARAGQAGGAGLRRPLPPLPLPGHQPHLRLSAPGLETRRLRRARAAALHARPDRALHRHLVRAHGARPLPLTGADAAARRPCSSARPASRTARTRRTRPLLLTLMARLQTKGGGSLPENREELYRQSVDMLLDEWEGLKLRATPAASRSSSRTQPQRVAERQPREHPARTRQARLPAHLQQPDAVGTADIRQVI
jgi:hypothetical protein